MTIFRWRMGGNSPSSFKKWLNPPIRVPSPNFYSLSLKKGHWNFKQQNESIFKGILNFLSKGTYVLFTTENGQNQTAGNIFNYHQYSSWYLKVISSPMKVRLNLVICTSLQFVDWLCLFADHIKYFFVNFANQNFLSIRIFVFRETKKFLFTF